jgi:hypothetical protein
LVGRVLTGWFPVLDRLEVVFKFVRPIENPLAKLHGRQMVKLAQPFHLRGRGPDFWGEKHFPGFVFGD